MGFVLQYLFYLYEYYCSSILYIGFHLFIILYLPWNSSALTFAMESSSAEPKRYFYSANVLGWITHGSIFTPARM